MTKFLNISTDNTLGGSSASNEVVPSQKAIKEYVDEHGGGGGSTSIDNKSITKNGNDELQTVGVIDQNNTSNAIKTWTGTRAQYNALVSGGNVDSNTIYNITDDSDISLTVLEALYPVGSIYITTANTCPLATLISGSEWTLVSSGRVLQGADSNHVPGSTIEAGLPNITGSVSNLIKIYWNSASASGAFSLSGSSGKYTSGTESNTNHNGFSFNASKSNSIYGNSNTVQPPAFCVNIFERTA